MPARFIALTIMGIALLGCAPGPRVSASPGVAANGSSGGDDETRAERYARGEYRRGFKHNEERNAEFCRLNPADDNCIGRRY